MNKDFQVGDKIKIIPTFNDEILDYCVGIVVKGECIEQFKLNNEVIIEKNTWDKYVLIKDMKWNENSSIMDRNPWHYFPKMKAINHSLLIPLRSLIGDYKIEKIN